MEENKPKYIPMDECEKGYVYRINSRNLRYGVYDGKNGFIGIRTKFDSRFLFTEYHWDQGPPYGTVRPQEKMDKVPDGIAIRVSLGTVDENTGERIVHDREDSVWRHCTDGVAVPNAWPVSIGNEKLFEYLETFESEESHGKQRQQQ